jgi:murein DD-endopeptidase MepM/ murein hydrolase activator NlpD
MSLAMIELRTRLAARDALQTLGRHPRRLTTAVVVVLGGFAATAASVAPMAVPEPALLTQRIVVDTVAPADLAQQAEALAAHDLTLWRADLTRATDTADGLLQRLGVSDPAASQFIRTDREARRLVEGRGGKMVQARVAEDGTLAELVARFPTAESGQGMSHFTRLTLAKPAGAWQAQVEVGRLEARMRLGSGTIRSSLFAAIDEAGLPDVVATQLAEMFGNDIDFHRALRRGDTFSVAFEGLYADGQPISWNEGAGRVLAAEFINGGQQHQALWFPSASGRGAYFGFDGRSKKRAFMASPMEFSRVTSGFAMRMHPIFRQWRQHNGVDYAAPTGTPVLTVGDGLVEFAGRQNGYGNVVTIRHGKEHSTVYAHLSRIDVKPDQRVEQGQRIGAVGATGYATGPHLHFEFKVNGEQRDPVEIARAAATQTLDATERAAFNWLSADLQSRLALAATVNYAAARGE